MKTPAPLRSLVVTIISLVAVVVAIFFVPHNAKGATVCGVGIKLNGKQVAGYADTWVGQTGRDLMGGLPTKRLSVERDFKIPVDAADPNKATLRGKIRLVARKRGDALLIAELDVLHLVKRDGNWFVAEADAKKALKAAKEPED